MNKYRKNKYHIINCVFVQVFQSRPNRTGGSWTQLYPLWQTAAESMELFMWTWRAAAWRPLTVLVVALKCLMVCLISKELRRSRSSLSLTPSPPPSAARKLCHGNRLYVLSQRWACWGNHGRKETMESKVMESWECDANIVFGVFVCLVSICFLFSWYWNISFQNCMQWTASLYFHPETRPVLPVPASRDSATYHQDSMVLSTMSTLLNRSWVHPCFLSCSSVTDFSSTCSGGATDCREAAARSRLLHYSASLHLVDLLAPPPLMATHDPTYRNTLSSDEG